MHINDVEKLKQIFQSIDEDGSGTIDISELRKALLKARPGEAELTDEQVQRRIAKYDADGNGVLDFEEYRNMLKNWETDEAEFDAEMAKYKEAFELIDVDKVCASCGRDEHAPRQRPTPSALAVAHGFDSGRWCVLL